MSTFTQIQQEQTKISEKKTIYVNMKYHMSNQSWYYATCQYMPFYKAEILETMEKLKKK